MILSRVERKDDREQMWSIQGNITWKNSICPFSFFTHSNVALSFENVWTRTIYIWQFFFLNTMHTSWKCQTKSKVTGVDPSGRNSSCMFNLSFRISFYSWNKLVRYIIHTFLVELLSHTVTDNESIPTKDHSPLECQCVWWWCQICKYELILSLLCSHDRDCIGYSFLCISI
jgi:hypothetical protein